MLDMASKASVGAYLRLLRSPVEIVATLDASRHSEQALSLLDDLRELSPTITVRLDGDDARAPSFSLAGPDGGPRVRFAGVPIAHELSSLVLALLQVSGYPPREDPVLLSDVASLSGPLRFETYYSLSCEICPDVVQTLTTMSAVSPAIEHTAIDGGIFGEEIAARSVSALPAVFLDGDLFGYGRMTLPEILSRLAIR